MNLKDLINKAKDVDVDLDALPSNGETKLTEGERYTVKVEEVRAGTSKQGTPSVSFFLRVVDGPDNVNRTFWDNFYFSENMQAGLIAKNLTFCSNLGVDSDVIAEHNFGDGDATLPFSLGVTAEVEAKYRENKSNPDRPWKDFIYRPGSAVPTVTVTVDDDDELSWDN